MTTHSLIKWTIEDYHRMIEAGILHDRHVELIAGEIKVKIEVKKLLSLE